MRCTRSLSAWLMLLVVAAGGVLGPAAHRAHHAVDRASVVQAARAGTCHSEAAHDAETGCAQREAAPPEETVRRVDTGEMAFRDRRSGTLS